MPRLAVSEKDERQMEAMSEPEFKACKRRLKRNFTRMLHECEQCIIDGEYWNRINPHEMPMDLEWFKVQAAGLRKCLAALEQGEQIEARWLQKQ